MCVRSRFEVLVALCAAAAIGGCELVAGDLPDPVHQDAGGAPATGGQGGGSGAAGSSAGSAGRDAGGTGGSPGGAGGQGGSAGCPDQCDCDGDGAKSKACGGTDCDDHDPKVKPGQSAYFAAPAQNPAIGFDYNCSGNPERDPSLQQVSCAGLSLLSCDTTTQGFVDQLPACGQSGGWGTCRKGSVSCQPDVLEQRVMLCH